MLGLLDIDTGFRVCHCMEVWAAELVSSVALVNLDMAETVAQLAVGVECVHGAGVAQRQTLPWGNKLSGRNGVI